MRTRPFILSALVLSASLNVGLIANLDEYRAIQPLLFSVAQYDQRVSTLLSASQQASDADIAWFFVYDPDYRERMLWGYASRTKAQLRLVRTSMEDTVYSEQLSLHREDLPYVGRREAMPPGSPLYVGLVRLNLEMVVSWPVYSDRGYLIGYASLGFAKDDKATTLVGLAETQRLAGSIAALPLSGDR